MDKLGSGGQGMVFKGTWKELEVAVKKTLDLDPQDIHILTTLGVHSNIIRLYGVIFQDDSCLIVTELVKEGSLHGYIHSNKKKNVPSKEQKFYWMKGIASGMEFLHHHDVVHRDLKSGNILLASHMTAKLCDFGTARALDHTTAQTKPTGTYRWLAPEVQDSPCALINKKCDVYSYAMVLYELVSLQLPFEGFQEIKALMKAMKGERPNLPESDSECEPFLHRLITASWDADPGARPTFQDINFALDRQTFPL